MTRPFALGGRLLAKNTFLSVMTQVLPLLVAVVATPYVLHKLGISRYGILTLSGVMLGYLSLVDLGLGRATVKYVAQTLGNGAVERTHKIMWAALTATLVLGFIGFAIVVTAMPFIVDRVFHVDVALQAEARRVFSIIAATSIAMLLRTNAEGMLEAYQRFDILSVLRTPSLLLSSILPAGIVWAGGDLPTIVLAIGIKDVVVLLIVLLICSKLHQGFSPRLMWDSSILHELFRFGKWLTLLNVASVFVHFMEPLLIAGMLTLSEVTYYTVPYDVINKLTILPASLMMVLFPAFSSLSAGDPAKVEALFWRGLKHLMIGIGWVAVFLVVFAKELLVLWLGSDFAHSAAVLQILAVGWVLAAISWHLSTLLQGTGHIKAVTAMSLQLVLLQVPLSIVLIAMWGIEGAAAAFTLVRIAAVAVLYRTARRFKLLGVVPFRWDEVRHLAWLATAILATTLVIKSSLHALWPSIILGALCLTVGYAWLSWHYFLNGEDKAFLVQVLRRVCFPRGVAVQKME